MRCELRPVESLRLRQQPEHRVRAPPALLVYWLPVPVLLGLEALHRPSRTGQALWGAAAGLLLGLILFSTYTPVGLCSRRDRVHPRLPIAADTARRVASLCRVGLVQGHGCARRRCGVAGRSRSRPHRSLPVLRANGGRTYEQVMYYALSPRDVINLGGSNLSTGRTGPWARAGRPPAEHRNQPRCHAPQADRQHHAPAASSISTGGRWSWPG